MRVQLAKQVESINSHIVVEGCQLLYLYTAVSQLILSIPLIKFSLQFPRFAESDSKPCY